MPCEISREVSLARETECSSIDKRCFPFNSIVTIRSAGNGNDLVNCASVMLPASIAPLCTVNSVAMISPSLVGS
jgi:hypothetical protein